VTRSTLIQIDEKLAQKAQSATDRICDAIVALLRLYPEGLRNFEVAKALGMSSPPGSGHRNHITHELLRSMAASGRVLRTEGDAPVYKVP
jgi:hypothetical protein